MSLNVLVDDPPIGGSFGQVKHDVHVGPHWPGAPCPTSVGNVFVDYSK